MKSIQEDSIYDTRLHCVTRFFISPQIKVQELEGQLFTEKQKNKEGTFQMEQLRKDITQHE